MHSLAGCDALEDAEDLAAVNARRAEEATRGKEAVRRNYLTAEEAERLWAGESPIKVWRQKRGLTQRALAADASVGASQLTEIEAGRKPGSMDTISARVLEVPAEWLTGEQAV
jgi:DNA-binding XRE family transcriptional regulator